MHDAHRGHGRVKLRALFGARPLFAARSELEAAVSSPQARIGCGHRALVCMLCLLAIPCHPVGQMLVMRLVAAKRTSMTSIWPTGCLPSIRMLSGEDLALVADTAVVRA